MRKRDRFNRALPAICSILVWAISLVEASALPYISTLSGTGCKATLSSPFENFPTEGALPLDLEIQNDRDQACVYTVELEGEAREPITSLTCRFKVEPHASEKFAIYLPLSLKMAYGYVSIRPTISGPGIVDNFEPLTLARGTPGTGLLSAISNTIYGKVDWTAKTTERQTHSKQPFNETSIDTTKLPTNWQGLSGLGSLMMTDGDWLALDSDQRVAVLDFVAMGGRLALFMKNESAAQPNSLGLPIQIHNISNYLNYGFHYGSGYIGLEPKKDLAAVSDSDLEGLIETWVRKSEEETAPSYMNSTWPIGDLVGKVTVNAPLIIIIVLSFSTLVGPINLIYFAPANQRIRLFWTTPLISLGASAILLLGILVGDGLGGKGRQAMVIVSLPELNQEIVLQEQASRTAVLMSTSWQNLDDALVVQIPQESPGYSGGNPSTDETFHVAGREMTGNWFKSRAISWQYLRTVRPSRSHLAITNLKEVMSGKEDPKLLSSFPDSLKEVHVTIGNKFWVAKNVAPGAPIPAESETLDDHKAFFDENRDHVGVWLKEALKDPETAFQGSTLPLASNETYFMAVAEPDDRQALRSLEAIRWQLDDQIYVGTIVDQEQDSHE